MMICDFCGEAEPNYQYEIPFNVSVAYEGLGLTAVADQSWAACPACAQLIDQSNLDGLVSRSLRMSCLRLGAQEAVEDDEFKSFLQEVYRLFLTHKGHRTSL